VNWVLTEYVLARGVGGVLEEVTEILHLDSGAHEEMDWVVAGEIHLAEIHLAKIL
jgi:hypothetical protein